MNPRILVRISAFAVASVLALLAGMWFSARTASPPAPSDIGGYALDEPRTIPPFELRDADDQPFRAEDFAGAWSFLYFGYTYCPDACPLTMVVFQGLKELLGDATDDGPIRYYLVSVDPARDSPARMAEYVAYFDPAFRGLVGPYEQLERLTGAAGVAYIPPAPGQGVDYLVDHSSSITLIDPDGKIHAIFTPPHDPASLAGDFLRLAGRE